MGGDIGVEVIAAAAAVQTHVHGRCWRECGLEAGLRDSVDGDDAEIALPALPFMFRPNPRS